MTAYSIKFPTESPVVEVCLCGVHSLRRKTPQDSDLSDLTQLAAEPVHENASKWRVSASPVSQRVQWWLFAFLVCGMWEFQSLLVGKPCCKLLSKRTEDYGSARARDWTLEC